MTTVLLIDDDVDLVEMNRAVLEPRAHQVLAACEAAETRGALAGAQPDMAVLEVMMESLAALAVEIETALRRKE